MQEILFKANVTIEFTAVKCSSAELMLAESDPSLISFEK